ncbi:MarR family transcriptional regulator [Micromonospora sp. DR5-3]|uniref:MarR family transcriptional regulator n=1 Tax=unclassified Micromonospora TaxID=2617518 RepID=UPI002105B556|nr:MULTISPECIES: MarR family transcriptional regulator [unclassified Micromonospora]MCW3818598.1 MarR family transcriptional regulator [Micromonospora sp. DR5-3]
MTDTPEPVPAHAMFKVLAALAELGEATAAAVADKAGLGYSTATAKLRAWEQTGQTERIHTENKRAVWRLTEAGRATVGTDQATSPAHDSPPDMLPDEPAQPAAEDDPVEVTGTAESPEEPPAPEPANPAHPEPSTSASDTTAPDAPTPPDGEEEPVAETDGDSQRSASTPEGTGPDTAAASDDPAIGGSRRAKGSLRGAVLDILEAHPDRAYRTSELCKLIDAANEGSGAKKASAGAVANAVVKLVAAGKAVQTVEKPATFQLAPTTGSR